MTLYIYPTLTRYPAEFSKDPITKSLVPPEKYGPLYGYELYPGTVYNITISYQNLGITDYALLDNFYNSVLTILPFTFIFDNIIYNVRFKEPIKTSQDIPNYKKTTISFETYIGNLNVI